MNYQFFSSFSSSSARYFPRFTVLPTLEERQGMIDIICPFIRGALDVFDIRTNVSEIAITGTGQRKNQGKGYGQKLERYLKADIIGEDTEGNQIFLAECACINKRDAKKQEEDKWKLGRSMKDSWDSTIKQITKDHHPHEHLATFGL